MPYERLRWFGNGTVQAALWMLFLINFLGSTIAGIRYGLIRSFCHQDGSASPPSDRVVNLERSISALNLLILVPMAITVLLVIDQIHPSCPAVLMYLPLLGTVSTLATVALLIVLVRTRRDDGWTVGRRIRDALTVCCLVLFVPYMFYWNLIGYHF